MMEAGVCEKRLLEYVKKSNPPPFLLKTYMLVEESATDDVISWNENGTGFVVWQPAEFAKDLLPKLFKHSNFSSFVRQLNTYGFRKVATSRWEFSNDKFQKGGKEVLYEIRRRKTWATNPNKHHKKSPNKPTPLIIELDDEDQNTSSTSSSLEYTSLVDENKKLKKENGSLSFQLTSMKNKCKELLDLVNMYSHLEKVNQVEVDERPMLFGVRLEVDGEKEKKRES